MTDTRPHLASVPEDAGSGYEIVIVAYRSRDLVEELLTGLPTDVPVAIVDNGHGVDGIDELAAGRTATRYLDGPGTGFAAGANRGAFSSVHDAVVFVNPDSSPSREQLDALVSDLRMDRRLAAVSATTVLPDGSVEIGSGGWEPDLRRAAVHSAGLHKLFPTAGLWARPIPDRPIDVDWLCGACMAVRRSTFVGMGGFDEQYFVYNEDVDFGRRAREAGMGVRIRTDLLVPHRGGGSGDGKARMLQMRGASFVRYVRQQRSPASVLGMRVALSAGYTARWAAARGRGRRGLAVEHAAYVTGLWRGAPDMS